MTATQTISVLIIEDNPGDQLLLRENLMSTHLNIAHIITSNTLEEGITHLIKQNFSIIFLDLFLPDSTGLESFLDLVKINQHTPVVIYSGLKDTEISLNAIAAGAQDFLIKGDYTIPLLEKTIRYSIERKTNQEALEISNVRYNLISKVTHDMVWDYNIKTGEVFRNLNGWKKIFRSAEDKSIGTYEDFLSKIHINDRERIQSTNEKSFQSTNQEVYEVECCIIRDDGTLGYIEDRGYIIRNEQGQPLRVIGATHDITERKIAEQNLLLSEQRFRSLVQNSTDLLAILDVQGNYIYVSPTSQNILGFAPEYLIGKNAFSFIHADDLEKTKETLAMTHDMNYVKAPLFRFRHANGDWRWIESIITNMIGNPAVNGIVVNSRDVTEKKIADDEIEKLSMIAKETINGVMIRDKQNNILWVNDAFTKMYGYTIEEVKGKNPKDFLSGPDTDPKPIEYAIKSLLSSEPSSFEILHYTKPGVKIYVRVQLQPVLDVNGSIKEFYSFHTDITKEKGLEETLALEEVIKQKEITEAVISAQERERSEIGRELHDNINQLLGAARLYIDMAKKDGQNSNSLLSHSSSYTLTAIEEIRKLSKTLITPLIKEKGLSDSIWELIEEIMRVHPIKIYFDSVNYFEDDLNEKFKLNIFRIVQEQINNTLKHAHAHSLNINIKDEANKLFLTIADDGVGFDVSKRKLGIGLSNIKSRSELYNGNVQINSEKGKGTTISIIFEKTDLVLIKKD